MKITITLDEKRVADLLVSGLESSFGIAQWGRISKIRAPKQLKFRCDSERKYDHIDGPMNDGWVEIEEVGDGDGKPVKHRLTRESIERGLAVLAEKYPQHFADWLADNDDAATSDALIQCALLGEIRYS